MKAFIAFTKKEFTESIRTARFLILAAIFVSLGIMSPLIAKLMPELLKSIPAEGMAGISFELPEPTAFDAWTQFFKNVGQIGMLALIILFCGITANEFGKGTLVNLLTKGLKRSTVVLSKFLAGGVIWSAAYLLCLAACCVGTAYFWKLDVMSHVFLSFFAPWLFGLLLIALLIFGGVLFKGFMGSLLTCGGAVLVLNLVNIVPKAGRFNPVILSASTLNLLYAQSKLADFAPAFIICVAMIAALVAGSVLILNKKQV